MFQPTQHNKYESYLYFTRGTPLTRSISTERATAATEAEEGAVMEVAVVEVF